jgi:hypothetical protein
MDMGSLDEGLAYQVNRPDDEMQLVSQRSAQIRPNHGHAAAEANVLTASGSDRLLRSGTGKTVKCLFCSIGSLQLFFKYLLRLNLTEEVVQES